MSPKLKTRKPKNKTKTEKTLVKYLAVYQLTLGEEQKVKIRYFWNEESFL